MTNSIRLPVAIVTRRPPTSPAAPSPAATRLVSSSSWDHVSRRPPEASTTATPSGWSCAAAVSRSATEFVMGRYFHTDTLAR